MEFGRQRISHLRSWARPVLSWLAADGLAFAAAVSLPLGMYWGEVGPGVLVMAALGFAALRLVLHEALMLLALPLVLVTFAPMLVLLNTVVLSGYLQGLAALGLPVSSSGFGVLMLATTLILALAVVLRALFGTLLRTGWRVLRRARKIIRPRIRSWRLPRLTFGVARDKS